ncbi:MAG: hypothetical protein Q6352_017710 [Candidatus Freyrarchaeum guaymaensis]
MERFLEIVRKNTGRIISPHLLDDVLAARRLDKDVLRVALEYVYENEEDRGERLRLLERNTEYILKRLIEEALFLSRLERLLEPLAELNRRLEQSGQVLEKVGYTGQRSEALDWIVSLNKRAEGVEAGQDVLSLSDIQDEERWLEALEYEKPTVLVLGKVFNFSLLSKDAIRVVLEAERKSRMEGNLTVLLACWNALRQFEEEECIDLSLLLTVARYLQKNIRETCPPEEEEAETADIYSSEVRDIEELFKLLGVKHRKTREGIEVLEPLEPYDWIKIPEERINNMKEIIQSNRNIRTIRKLCDKLNRMGLINLGYYSLRAYFNQKSMPVGVYLRICHILGIKRDVSLFTRWRRIDVENVDKAEGEWYNNYDVRVRIHPDDLKKLYTELVDKLEEEKISLDKFAASLMEEGSAISRGSHIKEILSRKFVDTKALLEICDLVGRDPKTLRELDHNSLPEEESVSLPRKVIRFLRSETTKKFKQFTELANEIGEPAQNVRLYLTGERGIPIRVLRKIENALGAELKDSLHSRMKIRRSNYSREIVGASESEWEVMIEKIEVKESDGVKRPILTFIHRRDKERGGITTEVTQTGETVEPTKTPWWLSSPNTNITIDRNKEFREGKDLLTYITEKCIHKAGSAEKLARILNISPHTPERLLCNKENDTVSLRTLLALAMFSGEIKKLSELTDYVERVGNIEKKHKPDLTIDWNNPEGVHIILNIYGDGGFYNPRRWLYVISYSNSQKDFVNDFVDNIALVCGITPTIEEREGLYYIYIRNNLIGISLVRAGVEPGNKLLTNPKIPKFVLEGSTQILKNAANAIIADEGTVPNAALKLPNFVVVPELEPYRNTLSQIEGTIRNAPRGFVYKSLYRGKLRSYDEILTIIDIKKSNILQGVESIISNLLEKQNVNINKKDIRIITIKILIYHNYISIQKQINLSREATRKLHQILGGFPGYKELMYANYVGVDRSVLKIPLKLSQNEVDILKKIGKRITDNGKEYYSVSVEKLPEELKKYADPPIEVLKMQKEYSKKEIEILIEGKPVKVRGMPSRISGKIVPGPDGNLALWRLIPGLVSDIKRKWEDIKKSLTKGKTKERTGE